MDIETLPLQELKALAYDKFALLEQLQNEIMTINKVILKKNQEAV